MKAGIQSRKDAAAARQSVAHSHRTSPVGGFLPSRPSAARPAPKAFSFRVSGFLRTSDFGLRTALFILAHLLAITSGCSAGTNTPATRTEDVIYGRKFGTALTLDVFRPEPTNNGCGIIFVMSGGWFSSHDIIGATAFEPFLKRGYTVFAVVHGSQPKFQIPEIIQDMHRSVRFIRVNAAKYGLDPRRFGVSGASAGGHLSLILGTQGDLGAADAKDPVDRASSAVQAVACFFPPTDFLNYGKPGESALGENILKDFKPAFGSVPTNAVEREKFGKQISPIYTVTSNLPPTFIIHGDADKLVPIQQAESFVEAARKQGATAKLVVKKGAGHGWKDWVADLDLCAQWFDEQLRGIKPDKTSP
jgi:acetyl esterase/lipase